MDGIKYRQDHFYPGLLNRSWLNLEQYEEEMFHMASEDNTIMSLLCAVHADLEEPGGDVQVVDAV